MSKSFFLFTEKSTTLPNYLVVAKDLRYIKCRFSVVLYFGSTKRQTILLMVPIWIKSVFITSNLSWSYDPISLIVFLLAHSKFSAAFCKSYVILEFANAAWFQSWQKIKIFKK